MQDWSWHQGLSTDAMPSEEKGKGRRNKTTVCNDTHSDGRPEQEVWLQGPEDVVQGFHPEVQGSETMPWGVSHSQNQNLGVTGDLV